MNIPIEVLGLFILIFIFFGWMAWDFITKKMIEKNYNPNDDKSRIGEEQRRADIATKAVGNSNAGQGELGKGQGILPPTPTEPIGQDSNDAGKTNSRFGSFFKRT